MPSFIRLLLVSALLTGCASREALPTFFVLTRGQPAATGERAGPAITIRSIELPAYLGGSTKIATRTGENGIHYAPTARWAEPLNTTIAQALAESLSQQPGISRATVRTAEGRGDDLKVVFERFEGNDHGEVLLVAHWTLLSPTDGTPIAQGTSRESSQGWKVGDYAALAAKLGQALQAMSADIARKVR